MIDCILGPDQICCGSIGVAMDFVWREMWVSWNRDRRRPRVAVADRVGRQRGSRPQTLVHILSRTERNFEMGLYVKSMKDIRHRCDSEKLAIESRGGVIFREGPTRGHNGLIGFVTISLIGSITTVEQHCILHSYLLNAGCHIRRE